MIDAGQPPFPEASDERADQAGAASGAGIERTIDAAVERCRFAAGHGGTASR